MTDPAALEPIPATTLHLAIDMQRLFAEPTVWHAPDLAGIVPAVERLSRARPDHTLFIRFVPPDRPAAASGRWQRYYERWPEVTGERRPPGHVGLVAPLAGLAAEDTLADKGTYSAFGAPALRRRLEAEPITTLVLSGVETDVCVLATLFDAVDHGYRVVVARDAVASGSREAHDAVLAHVLPRLPEQVDLATVDAILARWAV